MSEALTEDIDAMRRAGAARHVARVCAEALTARIEAIKAPFRRVPGCNEMAEGYAVWKARSDAYWSLQEIINLAIEATEELDWAHLAPEKSEEDADRPLRDLHAKVQAFFGASPESAIDLALRPADEAGGIGAAREPQVRSSAGLGAANYLELSLAEKAAVAAGGREEKL